MNETSKTLEVMSDRFSSDLELQRNELKNKISSNELHSFMLKKADIDLVQSSINGAKIELSDNISRIKNDQHEIERALSEKTMYLEQLSQE